MIFSSAGTGSRLLDAGQRPAPPEPRDWRRRAPQRLAGGGTGRAGLHPGGFLLASCHPSHAVPTAADRAVGARLAAGLRALGGDVAVPADPGLSLLAGMAPAAHQDAAYDVLRGTNQGAIASFRDSAAAAVTARRFSAIVTDGPGPPLGYPSWLSRYYQLCPQPLLAGTPAASFRPVAGISARPAALWLPRGSRVSCQAAVNTLSRARKDNRP